MESAHHLCIDYIMRTKRHFLHDIKRPPDFDQAAFSSWIKASPKCLYQQEADSLLTCRDKLELPDDSLGDLVPAELMLTIARNSTFGMSTFWGSLRDLPGDALSFCSPVHVWSETRLYLTI